MSAIRLLAAQLAAPQSHVSLRRPAKPALSIVWDPMRIAIFITTVFTVSRIHQHYSFMAKFRPVLVLVFAAALYAY